MTRRPTILKEVFETQIRVLAFTLQPGSVDRYRFVTRLFLRYLRSQFPEVDQVSQLRRDPHLLGWFRSLSEQPRPLSNITRIGYLAILRRLLNDLSDQGYPLPLDLIRRQDLPPTPHYLPKPLSLQDDERLQQELHRTDDLYANALLLLRATGIRTGECMDLPLDCLRQLGTEQWALHVPLGKLHTERLVPADPEVRRIVKRILSLRTSNPSAQLAQSRAFLLPRRGDRRNLRYRLVSVLTHAAQRADCGTHVTPHRLRHSFATEMLRLGVSLPALMKLLGHKDIRMTLRYAQVTQQDLQREFHQARQNAAAHHHRVPTTLAIPPRTPTAGLLGICQSLDATRHLLEMYRRQLGNEKTRRKVERLKKRLLAIASKLQQLNAGEK